MTTNNWVAVAGLDYSAGTLRVLQIAVFGCWILHLWFSPLPVYSSLPQELYSTTSLLVRVIPAQLLEWLLTPRVAIGLCWTAIGTCILSVPQTRLQVVCRIASAFLVSLHELLLKGFGGYSNHAQIVLVFITWIVAFAPTGRQEGSQRHSASFAGALVSAGLALTITYSLVACRRIASGGWEVFFDGSIESWVATRTYQPSLYKFEVGSLILASSTLRPILTTGFLITTLAELLSPLSLVSKWFRYIWLAIMIPFHVLTLLTMNILFWENLIIILVLFTKLGAEIIPRWLERVDCWWVECTDRWRGDHSFGSEP